MQTFTFDQLDERGKENAVHLYARQIVNRGYETTISKETFYNGNEFMVVFESLRSWRFTIHGERVA